MLGNKKIIIGTRGSRLSLAQTEHLRDELLLAYPGLKAEQIIIKIIKTSGDKFKTENLGMMGGKGLFVKELEESLLDKSIDIAVHSLKDVPTFFSKKLSLTCFMKRTDERDAFLSPIASSFKNLKPGSTVGTSSVRRFSQLKRLRDDLKIIPIRGNIDTRITKMNEGIYDSIVLAAAGLKRLGFHSEIKEYFEKDIIIPSAGQGIITIQCRAEDKDLKEILKVVNDKETQILAEAERSLLKALNGACDTPVGDPCLETIQNYFRKSKNLKSASFKNLKPGSTVGTSSVRRFSQLKRLRDDLKIIPIRGNIDTRITKMNEGIYDSIVLAAAGLKRLGFHSEIKEYFEKDVIIPSAGQGIITIQCRAEDKEVKEILKVVNDKETQILAEAERSLLEALNGACDTPVGANAIINDEGELFLQAELLSIDGKQCFRAHKTGIVEKAKSIGLDVANEILSKAGDNFIISETKLAHTIYKKSE